MESALNSPQQYNSVIGRQRKHFLLQVLADAEQGSQDPELQLIAAELGINLKTFNKYANELVEHGLGWFPTSHKRASTAQDWLAVPYACPDFLCIVSVVSS